MDNGIVLEPAINHETLVGRQGYQGSATCDKLIVGPKYVSLKYVGQKYVRQKYVRKNSYANVRMQKYVR